MMIKGQKVKENNMSNYVISCCSTADLTKEHYYYANSMQTAQRRIPIGGDDGHNKTWGELLVHYEKELENFKSNIALLKEQKEGNAIKKEADITPLRPADVKLLKNYPTVKLTGGNDCLLPECRKPASGRDGYRVYF